MNQYWKIQMNYGVVLVTGEDPSLYPEGIRLLRKVELSYRDVILYENIATGYSNMNQYDLGLEYYQKAYDLAIETLSIPDEIAAITAKLGRCIIDLYVHKYDLILNLFNQKPLYDDDKIQLDKALHYLQEGTFINIVYKSHNILLDFSL